MPGDERIPIDEPGDRATHRNLVPNCDGRVEIMKVVGMVSVRNDHLGIGMLHDLADLAGREGGVQCYVAQSALLRGQLPHHGIEPIGENEHDHVARPANSPNVNRTPPGASTIAMRSG
jgi:hypothetical protein